MKNIFYSRFTFYFHCIGLFCFITVSPSVVEELAEAQEEKLVCVYCLNSCLKTSFKCDLKQCFERVEDKMSSHLVKITLQKSIHTVYELLLWKQGSRLYGLNKISFYS